MLGTELFPQNVSHRRDELVLSLALASSWIASCCPHVLQGCLVSAQALFSVNAAGECHHVRKKHSEDEATRTRVLKTRSFSARRLFSVGSCVSASSAIPGACVCVAARVIETVSDT